jgi:hypothetical protein
MRARYYGIKGRCGYVHARCFDAFVEAQAIRDLQGRIVRRPLADSILYTAGHAGNGPCLHCGVSLALPAPAPEKLIPAG